MGAGRHLPGPYLCCLSLSEPPDLRPHPGNKACWSPPRSKAVSGDEADSHAAPQPPQPPPLPADTYLRA